MVADFTHQQSWTYYLNTKFTLRGINIKDIKKNLEVNLGNKDLTLLMLIYLVLCSNIILGYYTNKIL